MNSCRHLFRLNPGGMSPSHIHPSGESQDARTTDRLLTTGAFGALAFVVVLFVEGATRPGYNAWFRFGSELSLSDQGWMQIANFILCGLLVILGAVGLGRALQTGPGSTFGPILVGVFGLSLVSAGVFVMDPRPGYPVDVVQSVPPTLHSILHGMSGMVCFGSLAAAALVLARRFKDSSRIWMTYSILTGIIIVASFVAAAASSNVTGSPTGLWQRIGIVTGWGWLAILTLRLRSRDLTGTLERLVAVDPGPARAGQNTLMITGFEATEIEVAPSTTVLGV